MRYGGNVPLEKTVLSKVLCYNYQNGETVEVPKRMAELGTTFTKISDDFLMELEPSVYMFTIYYSYANGQKGGSYSQNVQIHVEGTMVDQTQDIVIKKTKFLYTELKRPVTIIISSDKICQITGMKLRLNSEDSIPNWTLLFIRFSMMVKWFW